MRKPPSAGFRFVGGDPALDLVNTVDWTPAGLVDELLTDHASLTRWAEGAGVASLRAAQRLRALGRAHPRQAAAALDLARQLRSALQRVFVEVAAGAPSAGALAAFDGFLSAVYPRLTLEPASPTERRLGKAAAWAWRGDGDELDAFLWPVVRSAAELIASTEAAQIRVCGGTSCGWMYVDRSRNGLRRWCLMETCGTREKSRRRANRSAARAGGRRRGGSHTASA
jgi:predicted RNA-binding Zn ribbon-like protein